MLALDLLEDAPAVDNGRRTGRKSRLHASVLGTPATSSLRLVPDVSMNSEMVRFAGLAPVTAGLPAFHRS